MGVATILLLYDLSSDGFPVHDKVQVAILLSGDTLKSADWNANYLV